MSHIPIHTDKAPKVIGTYSQAVRSGDTVYLSGQIGLDPQTMQMAEGIDAQIQRVFDNLKAVAEAAGGSLNDVVRFTVYLTDLKHFAKVNEAMAVYLKSLPPQEHTMQPVSGAEVQAGAEIYKRRCDECHQSSGSGGGAEVFGGKNVFD